MRREVARFFADQAERYRRVGDVRMAEVMEQSLSLNLEAERARELEREFDRDLGVHHGRLRDEFGDPFGGQS